MAPLERSKLFRDALAPRSADPHAKARARLLASYEGFRERAGLLAGEISRSFAHLTVHDGSHLDALWEMADLATGDEYTLNPLEAYVLGGAFLLHDLGLSVASYASDDPLRSEPRWSDALAVVLEQRLGRFPTRGEINAADELAQRAAEESLLRQLHAVRAEKLALIHWNDENGVQHHLIEDSELREKLGPTIGKIAHSHWWETSVLAREFPSSLGALPSCPREWVIDPLKLACLLRVADSIHLDSRRAPMFLRVLRRPTGIAADHWAFQDQLMAPQLIDGRVLFTSGASFPAAKSQAWWLCLETLQDVDRWVREVDALLADTQRARLEIRGVVGADAPERLAVHIPTEGWSPVDTHVQITNVAGLVEKLGGRELYGDDPTAALRELIQNASDAVRARRKLQRRPDGWGEIAVRLDADGNGDHWLEVQDNGVGMTRHVLTRGLLDFGTSYWASPDLPSEFPGLLAAGFESAGQFGIGFFSVFMLGDRVRVITRPYRAAEAATTVLEFSDGPRERPLLRPAKDDELLWDGGTKVRIHLNDPLETSLLRGRRRTLGALGRELCVALDTRITFAASGEPTVVIEPDWTTIAPDLLLRRLADREADGVLEPHIAPYVDNLRPIVNDDGRVVGRLAIATRDPANAVAARPRPSLVSIGGLRANPINGMVGIMSGRAVTAARDVGVPLADPAALARWATEQATLVHRLPMSSENLLAHARIVLTCGGDPGPLPIARIDSSWGSAEAIRERAQSLSEITLVSAYSVDRLTAQFEEHVICVPSGIYRPLIRAPFSRRRIPVWPPRTSGRAPTIFRFIHALIADAWSIPIEEIVAVQPHEGDENAHVQIGQIDGEPITTPKSSTTVLRRLR